MTTPVPVWAASAVPGQYDSLIIGDHIELLGGPGGVESLDPACPGVIFRLQTGYSLGEAQPTVDVVGSLLLDGERPFGRRSSNRTMSLPLQIVAPSFSLLAGALELLMYTCDADTFSLTWTRAQGADPQTYPLVFDCFRAQAATVNWGGVVGDLSQPIAEVTLTFPAKPFGRSDTQVVGNFPSALSGASAPATAVVLDSFASSSIGGSNWAYSAQGPTTGQSAAYDPIFPDWQGLFTGNGSTANGGVITSAIACQPSTYYNPAAEAWFLSPQGVSGVQIVTKWYTSGMSLISTVTGPVTNLAAGTPQLVSTGNLTSPATAAYVEFALQFSGTPASSVQCLVAGGPPTIGIPQLLTSSSDPLSAQNSATYTALAPFGNDVDAPSEDDYATWQLMLYGNGSTATPYASMTNMVAVQPNRNYPVSVWLGTPQGYASGAQVTVNWYTSASSYISTSTVGSQVPMAPNVPYKIAGSVTSPSTAAYAQVNVQLLGTPASTVQLLAAGGIVSGQALSNAPVTGWTGNNGGTVVVLAPWSNWPTFGDGSGQAAYYTNQMANANLTGLGALTFWAGFGSSLYFTNWSKKGGFLVFAFVLTDAAGNELSFSKTWMCYGSNNAASPKWQKIKIPLPTVAGFNYASVISYQLTITNKGTGDLRFVRAYLSDLEAVPLATTQVSPNSGTLYELAGLVGSARSPANLQVQQTGTASVTIPFTTPGSYQWVCPPGITSLTTVKTVGAGGGGSTVTSTGGGGGGGGGTSVVSTVAVTPGKAYPIVVGAGGTSGVNGGNSTFIGDSTTVTGNGGHSAANNSTTGGTAGAAGSGGYAGGAGGTGDSGVSGGGGGSSGGSGATGVAGANGSAGGAGGTRTGAGSGGNGRPTSSGAATGNTPGGGGGGGVNTTYSGGTRYAGGPGGPGGVYLTYNGPTPFQSLIAHRPSFYAPPTLCPFVPLDVDNVPNGSNVYPVPSIVPGLNARFNGTYTVVVCPYSWASANVARTITVTVIQYEQSGGASYSTSVSASITPNNLTQLSAPAAGTGFAVIGELTLPQQLIADDNLDCYFGISVTSGNTSDRFMDVLFLDTQGSSVTIQSPTSYTNFYIDAPKDTVDIGLTSGSLFDRADAVSVLDRTFSSGAPIDVDPYGNHLLMLYSLEGPPAAQVTYFPHFFLERTQ